jgi:hypothetical protein
MLRNAETGFCAVAAGDWRFGRLIVSSLRRGGEWLLAIHRQTRKQDGGPIHFPPDTRASQLDVALQALFT